MPNSIEIFENTLLQLITRQGTNNDRTKVILKSGELGYTTDTKRLFVGDGSTYGGNVIGNSFRGQSTNLTTLGSGVIGDIAYKTDENSIYRIITGDGTNPTDWEKIGGVYTAADGSIQISVDNKISVLSLSAGTISNDLMGQSIILDSTNRLTLSSTIATNSIITQRNNQYLKLPEYLSINSIEYTFPIGELENNKYLKTDAAGKLSWSALGSNVNYFTYNSGGILPVGTIISTLTSNNLSNDWILCNGQLLAGVNYPELSSVIGTTYGGNNVNFKVPNLNNRLLYGTSSNPYDSTTYTFTSASSSAALSANMSVLSAVGVNFFIKAKPDKVIKGTFRVDSPLNLTINGTTINDTNVSALTTLDSEVAISLPPSQIKVSYPLGLEKDSTDVTGTFVSIFDGDLNITGPTNTLKVDSPLKLTVAGNDKTGESISPYAGNLNLQLNTKNTIKANSLLSLTVDGVDKTGQIVNLDTPNQNIVLDVKNPTNTLKVDSPLKLTVAGNDKTGESISPYTGNLNLQLNTQNTIKANSLGNSLLSLTVDGVDKTGQIVNLDTANQDIVIDVKNPTNTLKVDSPLKLTVGGTNKTGESISPYTGNLNLQLNTQNTIKASSPLILKVGETVKTGDAVALDTPNQAIDLTLDTASIYKTIYDNIYPVGSVIFSTDNVNPQNRLGGTWTRISEGRFIVGVGTGNDGIQNRAFAEGNTYGEYDHQLSVGEMPTHDHVSTLGNDISETANESVARSSQYFVGKMGEQIPANSGIFPYSYANGFRDIGNLAGTIQSSINGGNDCFFKTTATGSSNYHNNTPPGFGMYVWKRTA